MLTHQEIHLLVEVASGKVLRNSHAGDKQTAYISLQVCIFPHEKLCHFGNEIMLMLASH